MPSHDQPSAVATADLLRSEFGSSALIQACVCGHEAMLANDVERCRFWREVIDQLSDDGPPTLSKKF
jgi:hypothetical protein